MSEVPEHLRAMIRNKTASLVLGAGVSIAATNKAPAASWKGLLESGIRHCVPYGKPPLSNELQQQNLQILNSSDTDAWLSVASLIERKLKYPENREWAKWLKDTVGALEVKDPNLPESLLGLELPIITTNYDAIFESRSLSRPLRPLTWAERFLDQIYFEAPDRYAFHLHGHYARPETVVLGLTSYAKILGNEYVQFFTRLLSFRAGLIFIGYGGGFSDPNFTELLKFVAQHGSAQRHFILTRDSEVHLYQGYENIYPVGYGVSHDDLPAFIRSLPFGRERYIYYRKSGDAEVVSKANEFSDIPHAPRLVAVQAGSYTRHDGRTVQIKYDFAISAAPVTLREWEVFVSETTSARRKFIGDQNDPELPVVGVTYQDCREYVHWLRRITGFEYRLPSETEWEFACLAGASTAYWWGDAPDPLKSNVRESGINRVSRVRSFGANPFGVFDSHGNIWEWCRDHFTSDENSIPDDGTPFRARTSGAGARADERVLKGGCFYYPGATSASKSRIHLEEGAVFNSVGFRVARVIPASIKAGQHYFVVSLVAPYAITETGDKVELANLNHGNNQKWLIEAVAGNVFQIRSVQSNRLIAVEMPTADYSGLTLAPTSAAPIDKWEFARTGGGYLINPVSTNKAIDVEGGRALKLPDLIVFERHGNFNQVWRIVPASP